MTSITFANNKGGVGKSTMSITIATELSKHGKTILVDTDPQANSGNSLIDTKKLDNQLSDVLNGKTTIDNAIKETLIDNLFVISSIATSQELRRYIQSTAPTEPYIFLDVKDELAKLGFEYTVFDTSPAFSIFEENIYTATNILIPVLLLDQYGIDGLETLIQNLENFKKRKRLDKPNIEAIILNQDDNRLSVSKSVKSLLTKLDSYEFFIMPTDQNYKKCVSSKKTVQFFGDTKKETLKVIEKITSYILEAENGIKTH